MLFNYYVLFSWLTRVKVRWQLGKIKNLNWWVACSNFSLEFLFHTLFSLHTFELFKTCNVGVKIFEIRL